jgi:hypothetical protein
MLRKQLRVSEYFFVRYNNCDQLRHWRGIHYYNMTVYLWTLSLYSNEQMIRNYKCRVTRYSGSAIITHGLYIATV